MDGEIVTKDTIIRDIKKAYKEGYGQTPIIEIINIMASMYARVVITKDKKEGYATLKKEMFEVIKTWCEEEGLDLYGTINVEQIVKDVEKRVRSGGR